MSREITLPEAVGQIYTVADTPGRWSEPLDAALTLLQSTAGVIGAGHLDGSVSAIEWRGYSTESVAAYEEYIHKIDPFLELVARLPAGRVFNDTAIQSRDSVTKSAAFQDFYRPNGAEHMLFAWIHDDHERRHLLLIQRNESAGPYSNHEIAVFANLVPHFGNVVRLQDRIASADSMRAASLETLNRAGFGVFFLDSDGRVLARNEAASRILAARDGVLLKDGRLRFPLPDAKADRSAAKFESLASNAGAPAYGPDVNIPRPSGKRPYLARIQPLPSTGADDVSSTPVTAVIILDMERADEPDAAVLRGLFALTPTEAALLARLSRCHSLAETADALGITVGTARWHLKRIFQKTGVRHQSELIALALRTKLP